MRPQFAFVSLLTLIAIGCSGRITTSPSQPIPSESPAKSTADTSSSGTVTENTPSSSDTVIELTPDNTLIQFVGTHVGEVPDPKARTGKFGEFAGKAIVADNELKSVSVEIQVASVDTGIEKLNNHLQAEDFFSVREYPTAKFESTKIVRNEDGEHLITGNLTLHSKTNEISFPASVGMVDGELKLSGKMKLDRTEFGMDKKTDGVNAEVDLTFEIGKAG